MMLVKRIDNEDIGRLRALEKQLSGDIYRPSEAELKQAKAEIEGILTNIKWATNPYTKDVLTAYLYAKKRVHKTTGSSMLVDVLGGEPYKVEDYEEKAACGNGGCSQ